MRFQFLTIALAVTGFCISLAGEAQTPAPAAVNPPVEAELLRAHSRRHHGLARWNSAHRRGGNRRRDQLLWRYRIPG